MVKTRKKSYRVVEMISKKGLLDLGFARAPLAQNSHQCLAKRKHVVRSTRLCCFCKRSLIILVLSAEPSFPFSFKPFYC